jgi:hypothetical protein
MATDKSSRFEKTPFSANLAQSVKQTGSITGSQMPNLRRGMSGAAPDVRLICRALAPRFAARFATVLGCNVSKDKPEELRQRGSFYNPKCKTKFKPPN